MSDIDLPEWASPDEWRPASDAEEESISAAAGCNGRCFVNMQTGERVLCDGADIILWGD